MTQQSAGLLMYRHTPSLEFFLIHPGGPFYKNKNEGFWSIPKGMPDADEDFLLAAQREFKEETGITPHGPFQDIGTAKTKSGKVIHAWAFAGDWNESNSIVSNTCFVEWPPSSGRKIEIPEADQARWFPYDEAIIHINKQQVIFLERLLKLSELNGR